MSAHASLFIIQLNYVWYQMTMGSNPGNFHRSMHELNFGSGSVPVHHPNSPGSSQKSSRSKKSSGRSSDRKPATSKTSRRSAGADSRSHSRSSRRRHQRRSETSEEEDLDEVSSDEEEDEDFFTGVNIQKAFSEIQNTIYLTYLT